MSPIAQLWLQHDARLVGRSEELQLHVIRAFDLQPSQPAQENPLRVRSAFHITSTCTIAWSRALVQKTPSRNIIMFSNSTACAPSHLEALDPTLKEIRVLDIAPASGDGIVECMMNHISLLHHPVPVYETISYSWGLSRAPSIIKINGHMTTVPASSEAALRRMRPTDRPRVLWIDAICIDQSSVTERSVQVAIMSLIYRTAMHNLIYLGENDGMAERGVKAIQNVVNDMRTATADLTLLSQTIYDEETSTSLYSTEAFNVDVDFEALEALFSLHWFR